MHPLLINIKLPCSIGKRIICTNQTLILPDTTCLAKNCGNSIFQMIILKDKCDKYMDRGISMRRYIDGCIYLFLIVYLDEIPSQVQINDFHSQISTATRDEMNLQEAKFYRKDAKTFWNKILLKLYHEVNLHTLKNADSIATYFQIPNLLPNHLSYAVIDCNQIKIKIPNL